MENRVRELNLQLQVKMRKRVKLTTQGHNSNLTSESPANTVTSLELPSQRVEIRTPEQFAISTDYYSYCKARSVNIIVEQNSRCFIFWQTGFCVAYIFFWRAYTIS